MERTQLVLTQQDLSYVPATLVSMETDTTAQVSQYHCQLGWKRLQKTAIADHYQKKPLKYDVYWCAIRSGIFFLPLVYFFKKTSSLKGLFDVCLVHFVNNANHMSLLTLIRNLELEKQLLITKKTPTRAN